jgi:hypothetical protein
LNAYKSEVVSRFFVFPLPDAVLSCAALRWVVIKNSRKNTGITPAIVFVLIIRFKALLLKNSIFLLFYYHLWGQRRISFVHREYMKSLSSALPTHISIKTFWACYHIIAAPGPGRVRKSLINLCMHV